MRSCLHLILSSGRPFQVNADADPCRQERCLRQRLPEFQRDIQNTLLFPHDPFGHTCLPVPHITQLDRLSLSLLSPVV